MSDFKDVKQQIDNTRTLRAIAGGQGRPLFVLVHGADRQFQNAAYWRPHCQWLSGLGSFLAVDMLGHGESTPGGSDALESPVQRAQQVSAIAALLDAHAAGHLPCVAVGRSYGGRVVLDLASDRPDLFNALILIAPSVDESRLATLPATVTGTPTLLVWADDDPVVPAIRRPAVLKAFKHIESVDMGSIDPPADAPWKAHTPEIEKPDLFRRRVEAFLASLP
jgi:pimeloyl-ACP methyl ester carboxylesterase